MLELGCLVVLSEQSGRNVMEQLVLEELGLDCEVLEMFLFEHVDGFQLAVCGVVELGAQSLFGYCEFYYRLFLFADLRL